MNNLTINHLKKYSLGLKPSYGLSILLLLFSALNYALTSDPSLASNETAQEASSYSVFSSQNSVVVSLAANPSTGFQWVVKDYDKSLLTLTKSSYVAPKVGMVGAAGVMAFIFAIKPGVKRPKSTAIQLNYQRSWEPDRGTSKTVTINFVPE